MEIRRKLKISQEISMNILLLELVGATCEKVELQEASLESQKCLQSSKLDSEECVHWRKTLRRSRATFNVNVFRQKHVINYVGSSSSLAVPACSLACLPGCHPPAFWPTPPDCL